MRTRRYYQIRTIVRFVFWTTVIVGGAALFLWLDQMVMNWYYDFDQYFPE
jgi:hypothetical protein